MLAVPNYLDFGLIAINVEVCGAFGANARPVEVAASMPNVWTRMDGDRFLAPEEQDDATVIGWLSRLRKARDGAQR